MATHLSEHSNRAADLTRFGGGPKLIGLGAVLGIGGLAVALSLGFKGMVAFRPFLFGYLAAYSFVLALALGSLTFVLLQHLTRAAWSVGVRRTAENFAATLPVLAVFALPMIISVAMQNGGLYRWALPLDEAHAPREFVDAANKGQSEIEEEYKPASAELAHPVTTNAAEETEQMAAQYAAPSDPATFKLDPLVLLKRSHGLYWLNPWFFVFRALVYLVCWSGIALWFRGVSVAQDTTGDESLTLKMQGRAAPALVVMALTVTGFAFDMLMSLDPHWYSTMFGVIYIAESFIGSYALLIITLWLLQKLGYIRSGITPEHYHDLGKYLFGFTFFFGYVAFSQYMLMWYANIPEETIWFARHGASTAVWNGWNKVIVFILFFHVLIPFAGLISRHIKRNPGVLVFWAVWQLLFVAVDMYWIVMPEFGPTGPETTTVLITVCAAIGLFGVFLASFGAIASKASLCPTHDPRLADSLAFQNI